MTHNRSKKASRSQKTGEQAGKADKSKGARLNLQTKENRQGNRRLKAGCKGGQNKPENLSRAKSIRASIGRMADEADGIQVRRWAGTKQVRRMRCGRIWKGLTALHWNPPICQTGGGSLEEGWSRLSLTVLRGETWIYTRITLLWILIMKLKNRFANSASGGVLYAP